MATAGTTVEVGAARPGSRLAAGAAAGALAALAMMAFMAASAAWDGGDALEPLRAVGATFRDVQAPGGPATIAWGVVLHLAVGVAFGVLYASFLPPDFTSAAAMVLGAGCAVLVMALAVSIAIPAVAPVLAAEMPRHGGAWVIAYALFGAVAGVAPALRRRLGAPHRPVRALRPRTAGGPP